MVLMRNGGTEQRKDPVACYENTGGEVKQPL
jgi:hypothetical protein